MKWLLLALLLFMNAATVYGEVWGSTRSKVYHQRLCRWNAQIKPEYRTSFSSPAAAVKAGYKPCEKCRPPLVETRNRPNSAGKESTPHNSY